MLPAALNLLPSIATCSADSSCAPRQNSMKARHAPRIAAPLSFLKSAIVLKSGCSRFSNHITSTLRWHSCSKRRLVLTRFKYPYTCSFSRSPGWYGLRPVSFLSALANPNALTSRVSRGGLLLISDSVASAARVIPSVRLGRGYSKNPPHRQVAARDIKQVCRGHWPGERVTSTKSLLTSECTYLPTREHPVTAWPCTVIDARNDIS